MMPGKTTALKKKIEIFNRDNNVKLLASHTGRRTAGSGQTSQGSAHSRTLCEPVFTPPAVPTDMNQQWTPETTLLQAELEAKEFLSSIFCRNMSSMS